MRKKPQHRFFLVLAAFLAVFLVGSNIAYAKAFVEGRYFVSSKNMLIKSLFGAQHDFEGGFTADLTSGEVWTLEKIFKTNVSRIPLYEISDEMEIPVSASGNIIADAVTLISEKETERREFTPSKSITSGIRKIYGTDLLVNTSGGKDVNVAVLDTGANVKHVDLVKRVKDCKDFTRGPVPRSACEDKQGHGTHVAGIVSADGGFDGKGIWGVASESNLLIYKVCRNDGTCWADDVASAVSYATGNGANIIVIGLGGRTDSFLVRDAIANSVKNGVMVVAAVGNSGPDKNSIDFPAAYKDVVSVAALADDSTVPDWSSRGINDGDYFKEQGEIELSAAGVNIESTWLDGSYRYLSGTSMSTAYVGGLAAKLWDGSATSTRLSLFRMARDVWMAGDDTATGLGMPVIQNSATK